MSASLDLRLADMLTLLAVQRTTSITGAARELRVTPSQVSKTIVRVERYFGVRLMSRGARGVVPTAVGQRLLPRVASAVAELRAMAEVGRAHPPVLEVTLAGPSYLVARVLPPLVTLLPAVRVRGLELVPAHLRACVAEGAFDVALAPGGIDNTPAAWTSEVVGLLRSGLFARPAFAKRIGRSPLSAERAGSLPFVGHSERFGLMRDDCPLPWEKRWIAHDVQTVGSALEFISRSDHVVFCPVLAASLYVQGGALIEVHVTGWDVKESLHVVCNRDRVLSRLRRALLLAATEALGGQPRPQLDLVCDPSNGRHEAEDFPRA